MKDRAPKKGKIIAPHSMTSIHRHVCVYCGAVAESRDHVPPKAWFAREARTLIRVPACNTCNHGRSAADEEFRIALSLLAGLKTPTLRKLWKKSLKTLRHAPRIQRKFASGVFKDQATGRSGINLPRRMFDDAMTRIVRGLHWYHYRELVPIDAPNYLERLRIPLEHPVILNVKYLTTSLNASKHRRLAVSTETKLRTRHCTSVDTTPPRPLPLMATNKVGRKQWIFSGRCRHRVTLRRRSLRAARSGRDDGI